MSISHIKLKSATAYTQQFKLKLLELIVYIMQIQKKCGELILISFIFLLTFTMKRRSVHFFIYSRFLIEITSTSQTSWSGSRHVLGRINNSLPLCNKRFDQKLPDAFALAGFSMFGLAILFFYTNHVTNSWCMSCKWY